MPRAPALGQASSNSTSNKQEGLRFLYTNADQLPNKFEELELRVKIEKPHIILITEVNNKHVKTKPALATFQLEGYQLFHQNVSAEGRGILIYVQDSITGIIEVTAEQEFSENKIISIKFRNNKSLLVACLYRSESGTRENNSNMLKLIKEIAKMKQTYKLVVGDLNYKMIDWENWQTPKPETSEEHQLINCIQDIYWHQHVTSPTRYREGVEPSLLDLILTNDEHLVEKLEHLSPLGKSDHSMLSFEMKIKDTSNYQPRTVFNYDKGNYGNMIKDLSIDWQTEFLQSGQDTTKQWELLKSKIKSSQKNHIPTYQTSENHYLKKGKIPLNEDIRKEIRKKHRCWQRAYETKSRSKYQKWKRQRNKVTKLIEDAEIILESNIASESKVNPKKLWKYIKSRTKPRSNISHLINNKTGKLTENDKEQAEVLASQFSSVMVNEPDGELPDIPDKVLETPQLSSIHVTEEMVLKKLRNLDPTKSPGPDDIHPRVLKETASAIAPALTALYNNILTSHDIPEDWRTAIITAIFKKGAKSDPGNYRPVSLTCIICKILESIIYDAIIEHLIKNKLLSKNQYGFISRRSASLQLLAVLQLWCSILDESGNEIHDINMDFMKAFDTVPHRRLIKKLRSYGITGDILLWIEAFLQGRKQKVVVNGSSSGWCDVISGVPQGSVIAALLFVIYINDLPENIRSHLFLFADNCKFFREIATQEDIDIMQADLDTLFEWSQKWLLTFHPGKCVNLRITLRKDTEPHVYHLGNDDLKNVDEVKDLGVTVDGKLKFESHISGKVNKANQLWGAIKKAFKHMNSDIFKKLFCAHIRPHIEYAVQFWAPYLRKSINQIESVQRRATKNIPGFQNHSYKERLQLLDLPTLAYRRLRGSMIEVYKMINVYDPEVTPPLDIRSYRTRGHNQRLYVKPANKLHPKHHSFQHRVVNPWNSLPSDVVNSPNLDTFKNRLDKHWKNLKLKFDHESRDFES